MTSFNWKSVLMIALFFIQSFAIIASPKTIDNSELTIEKAENSKIVLKLEQLNEENTAIKLFDSKGQLLFSKNVMNQTDYGLSLDLSKLANGAYKLEVSRKEKIYTEHITVDNDDIQLSTVNVTFRPVIEKTQTGFSVTNPTAIVQKVVLLTTLQEEVYEKNYNESEQNSASYATHFNLEEVVKGEYIVRVETANGNYFKSITVK